MVPRSDGKGKFDEGGREPMAQVGIDSEFIVAASEVLDEGVPSTDHPGRTKLFQPTHRPPSTPPARGLGQRRPPDATRARPVPRRTHPTSPAGRGRRQPMDVYRAVRPSGLGEQHLHSEGILTRRGVLGGGDARWPPCRVRRQLHGVVVGSGHWPVPTHPHRPHQLCELGGSDARCPLCAVRQ